MMNDPSTARHSPHPVWYANRRSGRWDEPLYSHRDARMSHGSRGAAHSGVYRQVPTATSRRMISDRRQLHRCPMLSLAVACTQPTQ